MNRKLKTLAALALSAALMAGSVLTANAATTSFSDVPTTHWAYSYVTRAAQAGLVSGVGDGRYGVESNLSTAEFATMVSQLLDIEELIAVYQGQSAYWWYPYVEAAYQAGALTGTTAGNRRATDGRWTATVVEADMNRYDMAQIIANVAATKNWAHAEGEAYLLAMLMIPDWSQIPAEYQSAVALSYANGFISGMEDGSFAGSKNMTRGQAAVVLCALLEAKNEVRAPSYTNPDGWLVNGSEANEDSVMDALDDLKLEYPNYDIWDPDQVYTSDELGSGTGSRGFAYMLSDRVFGACSVTVEDGPNYVKPGDVIYLDEDNVYGVVTEVDGDLYEYVYCDEDGIISWYGSGDMDDLGSYDTVYSRYEGEGYSSIDEDEVADLIDEFLDRVYDVGDTCDESEDGYRSRSFSNSTVYGDRAFAYYMSDYLFDDRDVEEYDGDELDLDEIHLGDVIYLDDEDLYVVVTGISTRNDEIDCLYTNSSDRVVSNTVDYDSLDRYDTIYTRYEGESTSSSGSHTSSGDLDESDVADLIDDFLNDEYDVGEECYECEDGYRSSEFVNSTVYDDRAFAYYMSDYIFGDDQPVDSYDGDELDLDEIRLGDVIYLDDEDLYVVVTDVDTRYDEITYLYTNNSGKVRSSSFDYDDLDYYDTIYTRYEDSPSGSGSSSSRLTESDVLDLIDDFFADEYAVGDTCYECEDGYRSRAFSNSTVYDDRAFAYYMSDYLFDDREMEQYDGDEVDLDDIRVGDVLYLDDEDLYVVVTEIDTRYDEISYVYTNSSDRVRTSYFDYDDLDYYDTLYTRY